MKEQNLSFILRLRPTVIKIANEIEAFRYRFYEGKVVLFDQIDTAFTYLSPKTGLFKVVNVPFKEDLIEYVNLAKKAAEKQEVYFTAPLAIDVFQCASLPWINYKHISPINSEKKDNSTILFD